MVSFVKMSVVYFFSGSGHSEAVAKFFAEELNTECLPINNSSECNMLKSDYAIIVFPVYCQNIPAPVKKFLKILEAENAVLIATYGKVSCGNVLFEAARYVNCRIVAGAYVPIGHTFLHGDFVFDKLALHPVLERIGKNKAVSISKRKKNVFSGFFPNWRSRVGVKIYRLQSCNSCNICGRNCPVGAIDRGKINHKCIRCMKCVTNCPCDALVFKNSKILQSYLERHTKNEVILYL